MISIFACFTISYTVVHISAQKKQKIFFADPTIWEDGCKYYLTGTGRTRGGPTGVN
jgi:hypothetical protein